MEEMMKDNRMRGWMPPGAARGAVVTNPAVLDAVALCPLKADTKRTWFEADEFFRIVLQQAEAKGQL